MSKVRVTRDVPESERHNFLDRDVKAGEIFRVFNGNHYGAVDTSNGIALSDSADGGYSFFEFPRNAVEFI